MKTFVLTKHAVQRFETRFPGKNLAEVLERSYRLTTAQVIAEAERKGRGNKFDGRSFYYRDDVTGCYFVMRCDDGRPDEIVIVSCFKRFKPAKRKPAKTWHKEDAA